MWRERALICVFVSLANIDLWSSSPVFLRCLHSFPTRRSSDLLLRPAEGLVERRRHPVDVAEAQPPLDPLDRKSTRLNSSHGYISYAAFCLQKKNMRRPARPRAGELSHLIEFSLGSCLQVVAII